MTVDENKSICRTISKETKFYLEHIIIYFERTFLVINVIKYLIKEGSHSKQAWVDILSLLYDSLLEIGRCLTEKISLLRFCQTVIFCHP